MTRLLLVFAAGLALAACDNEAFTPPPLPDLYKTPYDFSVAIPPFRGDGGVVDMQPNVPHDLAMGPNQG